MTLETGVTRTRADTLKDALETALVALDVILGPPRSTEEVLNAIVTLVHSVHLAGEIITAASAYATTNAVKTPGDAS